MRDRQTLPAARPTLPKGCSPRSPSTVDLPGLSESAPFTSITANIYPFQVLLGADSTGLSRDSKALAEQVRSVDVEHIGALVGTLDGPLRAELDEALRLHLSL
ncbi:type II toxin-antitoxin system PemK/MazF family toxin [uncultured Ilumatobacter sp.]|uniref:type II toxin-antitoxin system PemK/MazF family toxin n=1 Tax=uncultured Ilumatobacter sp. TaxID=879968 RepID=UPI00374F564E